jgi:hypothetical protein
MTQVSCKTTINISADALWQVISDFGAAGEYFSGVVACKVKGEGVGALRTLTSVDGSTIIERLEVLDGDDRQLSYALLTDTPFQNCLTTMEVHELGPSRAELGWLATFQADGIPESEAVEMLEAALSANCISLKQFMERENLF